MERVEAIAAMAAALSPSNFESLPELLPAIIPEPLPAEVAYELLLQSHLFFGYAQAIEAARVFAEFRSERAIDFAPPAVDSAQGNELRARGESLCQQVYQPNFERLIDNLRRVSPELTEWMVVDGYGKVLSRPGPTAVEREVASIVFLAESGHPVQLYSHVRAVLNLGVAPESLLTAIGQSGLATGKVEAVRATLKRVFRR